MRVTLCEIFPLSCFNFGGKLNPLNTEDFFTDNIFGLGETTIAESMTYLDNGYVYIGSRYRSENPNRDPQFRIK
jgi:hypothetical protein